MAQRHRRRHTRCRRVEVRLDTQETEDVTYRRVALFRTVHQSLQPYLVLLVLRQRHHLIPIRGGTPVVFYQIRTRLVGLGSHADGLEVLPVGIGTKLTHCPQRQVDIGSRNHVSRQAQRQAVAQHRTDEQQGRDELRADVAGHLQQSAFQPATTDAQRGKALVVHIFDVGTQQSQGIYQHTNRTVPHALRSRQHMFFTLPRCQVCRHETHGSSCRHDVYLVRILLQGTHDDLRVVAIRQIVRHHTASRQRIDNQRTVGDAFRRREFDRSLESAWSRQAILHKMFLFVYL